MNAPRAEDKLGRRLAIVASIVVLATVVASVWVTGSPSAQREARIDERRVSDLNQIKDAIRSYTQQHGALPADLAELKSSREFAFPWPTRSPACPMSMSRPAPRTYQLRARFTTDTALQTPERLPVEGCPLGAWRRSPVFRSDCRDSDGPAAGLTATLDSI